jgi:predicted DNA-binding helix-hairpin-helix protein
LVREHRLYQGDWLMRFYGFAVEEVFAGTDGMLPLDMDPKLAWALRHRARFPLDINTAGRDELLRVPGFGLKTVERIIAARRIRSVRTDDLKRLHVPLKSALPFIVTPDHRPTRLTDRADLHVLVKAPPPRQLSLFANAL